MRARHCSTPPGSEPSTHVRSSPLRALAVGEGSLPGELECSPFGRLGGVEPREESPGTLPLLPQRRANRLRLDIEPSDPPRRVGQLQTSLYLSTERDWRPFREPKGSRSGTHREALQGWTGERSFSLDGHSGRVCVPCSGRGAAFLRPTSEGVGKGAKGSDSGAPGGGRTLETVERCRKDYGQSAGREAGRIPTTRLISERWMVLRSGDWRKE